MPIRGVIFDFDGTLADTLPDIAAAVNDGLRELGLPDRPLSDVREWVGEGLPTTCARALATFLEDPRIAHMVTLVTESYRRRRLEKTAPYPGIPGLLDALMARGIQLAILTNKPHEHTMPMTQALFSKWTFTAVEGYRVEDRRKPDPRTAWEIVSRMCLPRDAVALVGDSSTDVRTAINAGLIPIGATWGYRSREELVAEGARFLLASPVDLLGLLE